MGKPIRRRIAPETYSTALQEPGAEGRLPKMVIGAPWLTPDPNCPGDVDIELLDRMLHRAMAHLVDSLVRLHVGKTIMSWHIEAWGGVCERSRRRQFAGRGDRARAGRTCAAAQAPAWHPMQPRPASRVRKSVRAW